MTFSPMRWRVSARKSTALSPPLLGFPKMSATLFEGPYNKDFSILGSISDSPSEGK